MGRVKIVLFVFLVLMVLCQGLDPAIGTKPALSEFENQKFDSFQPSILASFQEMIGQAFNDLQSRLEDRLATLEQNLNEKINSLDSETDNKLSSLQKDLNDNIGVLDTKTMDGLSQLQSNVDNKNDKFENRLKNFLDIKIDNISKELATCDSDTKSDILNSSQVLMQRSDEIQKMNLDNFSETFEESVNMTLGYLTGISSGFESCKEFDERNLKNQTEVIIDVLTSWKNSISCQSKDSGLTDIDSLRSTCHRGMAYDAAEKYQPLEIMRDNTLGRDILCDTKTAGGGWIVIQRRTKGDVDFYRTWEEYKNGFGSPPGDFWLGNEAIHNLTSQGSYELRIDLNDSSQEVYAEYSFFELDSEADNYRLRLGLHSGTLEEETRLYGLSYHNGGQFSTPDKDNDDNQSHCAEINHGAWWYRTCQYANLNGKWGDKSILGVRWYTGPNDVYPSSTEMKIRLI